MNKPLLHSVTIEITNRCQLRCQHCGIWAEKERHEMTFGLVVHMMGKLLARYRIRFVSITGGEPFLNKDCGRILKAMCLLRKYGVIRGVGVYTNAAYFEGIRRVFSSHGQNLGGLEMGISIDGGQETHDCLRGPGSYQKTLRTIEWITEKFGKKIMLDFKFTVNKINYMELDDVYRLAKRFHARFYPKIMETGVINYYHRRKMSNTDKLASLTPNMEKEIRRQVAGILKDGYFGVDSELVKAMMALLTGGRKCVHACATPGKALFINSRRYVYPCLYLSPAGKVDDNGNLPVGIDQVRQMHAHDAAQGHCPGCFSYHGFLKKFNLRYLEK